MAAGASWPKRFILVILLLSLGGLLWFHLAIEDWLKLRDYSPPADIVQLAKTDTMTAKALHLYYINHPILVTSSTEFAKNCPIQEQTIVLGCYRGNEDGIYLRQISDSRLTGVEEVTAAHEMLHGAYDRLSKSDKNYVDGLLMNFYQTGLHDQRIIDTINSYKQSEPNDLINEMHSIFATEVANLPAPLEAYYQRYFTNRSAVIAQANNYQVEFTSRSDQIKAYEVELNSLKQQINSEEADLGGQSSQIQSDRARLDGLRQSGQISAYNAGVAGFNQEVEAYNNGVNKLKADISTYNSVVDAHNQLATELRSLYSALGTNLNTVQSQ